jgi:hypothetical protein
MLERLSVELNRFIFTLDIDLFLQEGVIGDDRGNEVILFLLMPE